ncbi:MAG: acyl carrier protein [Luteolibacter sp.]
MSDSSPLHEEIKAVLVDELMLDIEVEEIENDTLLMGPDSLGLDSVDALQLVVAIEKNFGLKITDTEAAKGILRSVDTIAEAVTASKSA